MSVVIVTDSVMQLSVMHPAYVAVAVAVKGGRIRSSFKTLNLSLRRPDNRSL